VRYCLLSYIHPFPFAIRFALELSGKNLRRLPSRELNWGLPYGKPKVVRHAYQSSEKEDCFNPSSSSRDEKLPAG
jgi:hypothetical protein